MMTLDECRDWLAMDEGWLPPGSPIPKGPGTSWPQDKPGTLVLDCWTKMTSDGLHVDKTRSHHDIEDTLDAAALALPEGWSVGVRQFVVGTSMHTDNPNRTVSWNAFAFHAGSLPTATAHSEAPEDRRVVCGGNTELLARFRLAVACRMASKEKA